MAHDVFISHASKDKAVADAVCSYLENERIRCWIAPRDVTPGKKYAQDIMDAIRDCRVMVVIFSSGANESEHVSAELERAMNRGIIIIPFRIEDVMPTGEMEYYLGGRHWLDAITVPMEQHIQKLVRSIQTILGNPVSANDDKAPAVPKNRKPDEGKKKGSRVMLISAGSLLLLLLLLLVWGAIFRNLIFPDRAAPAFQIQSMANLPTDAAQTGAADKENLQTAPAEETKASDPKQSEPSGGKHVNAEITDQVLIDGWAHINLKNGAEKGDVYVVIQGLDSNNRIVSLETMFFYAMSENEVRDLSTPLGGNPTSLHASVVKDYGGSPKILEEEIIDGWAHIVLANGGQQGDLSVVVKGFDSSNQVAALDTMVFYTMSEYEVRDLSAPVSGNPESLETYIVKDFEGGPEILEYEVIDGWAHVVLANGGEESDYNVAVKGFDEKGKVVSSEVLNFYAVKKYEIRDLSTPLSGNPVKMEASMR